MKIQHKCRVLIARQCKDLILTKQTERASKQGLNLIITGGQPAVNSKTNILLEQNMCLLDKFSASHFNNGALGVGKTRRNEQLNVFLRRRFTLNVRSSVLNFLFSTSLSYRERVPVEISSDTS